MKFAIALCLMVFSVAIVVSKLQHSRGCKHILGRCISDCPVGTHAFTSSCGGRSLSAPTCSSPKVHDLGGICDVSRCDCDTPTILDETTGKCVQPEDCPK